MRALSPRVVRGWIAAAACVLAGCILATREQTGLRQERTTWVYPPAPTVDVTDVHHGESIADPYRWLEDPADPRVKGWIEAENALTCAYLEGIPRRPAIRERLTALWNYEKHSPPHREGQRYFFTRNDGLQNQAVLYTLESLDGEPRNLLDPNKLSNDGTVALSGYAVSDDGALLAYGTSSKGSDWQEWRVRNVATGADLPDVVRWVKFSSAAWTRDARGFFYSRYDEPREGSEHMGVNYFQKLCYHRLGTLQSEDILVYHRPDRKEWAFDGEVTEDGRYLVITSREGTDPRRRIFYQDLEAPGPQVVELLGDYDAAYDFIGNDGTLFWFRTDSRAPRGRLIGIDVAGAARGGPLSREVIPEIRDTLAGVTLAGDSFIAAYLKDARTVLRLFRLDGSFTREVDLPGIGTASGFRGKRRDPESFFSFTGFTTPAVVLRLDLATGRSTVFRAPRLAFDPGDYETKQVFLTSRDGTRLPMFVTHRRGLELEGINPALLFGYGGFNISITPVFSVMALVWMEMGGVYAVPNLRGGGEYGEEWHEAGTKLGKQRVFDDFIAAAEWLIANGYTSSRRLAIHGRSNGGLLVGACMTQRPELFGAALPAVGVMDMLRYSKFTIGWAWVSDFGSPEDPQEFRALRAYSPYHNLRKGTAYPATLVTTGDHDDRVVPAHSFKFAAALQAAQGGAAPVMIRIETRAGHGSGKPTSKLIEEAADQLAFLVRALEVR